MIEFEFGSVEQSKSIVSIKVIGIGGAGGNTLNSIIESGHQGIEFIAVNTDAQALELSRAKHKIQIGLKSTKGFGTGANPEIGKRSAQEDIDKIIELVGDADIVFLAAGMGGGTGSGALPVIASALREKNILTIAIITKPFLFEGKRRISIAQQAIKAVEQAVDTLVIIPNQKLLELVDKTVSMVDGFAMINDILAQSIRGISDIVTKPGHINVDFADVRSIMQKKERSGLAIMGTGRARGAHRAQEAALQAITSPLLENMSIAGASGVLLNISGDRSLKLHEISEAASVIYEAQEDANIIIGSVVDETLGEDVVVTIVATGVVVDQGEASEAQKLSVDAQQKAYAQPVPGVSQTTVADQTMMVSNASVANQPLYATANSYASSMKHAVILPGHHEAVVSNGKQLQQHEFRPSENQAATQAHGSASASRHEAELAYESVQYNDATQAFAQIRGADVASKTGIGSIDQEDLDIPAFMRKELAQKDS